MDPHSLLIQQLANWLGPVLPQVDDRGWYFGDPPGFESGRCCAIFWGGDDLYEPANTTASIGLTDLYLIRYWEPADEPSRTTVDEVAAEGLGETLQAIRGAIFAHPHLNQTALGQAYQLEYAGARRLGAADGASSVRGFEVSVMVRRSEELG